MQFCLSPHVLHGRDRYPVWDKALARWTRAQVACGRCKACCGNRKQDWSGRLIAEGVEAGAVAFVTLTYKREPEGFPYSHIQQMLKRLRIDLWRNHDKNRVRFFVVGERGTRFGRAHWHILLFFEKPHALDNPARGQLWDFWPHGWTDIQHVEMDFAQMVKRIRYCSMYSLKAFDDPSDTPRPRCSLKPALGSAWLIKEACRTAAAGLAPDGKYRFDGVCWTRGPKTGERVAFTLRGASRLNFVDAWHDEWERLYPDKAVPWNDWLARYDDRGIFPLTGRAMAWRLDRPGLHVAERNRKPYVVRTMLVGGQNVYGTWMTELRVYAGGLATVTLGDGRVYAVVDSIIDVLALEPDRVIRIDKWLRKVRGPNYLSEAQHVSKDAAERASEEKRRVDVAAAIGASADAAIALLRAKHGVAKGLGGIYDRSWSPDNREPLADLCPVAPRAESNGLEAGWEVPARRSFSGGVGRNTRDRKTGRRLA